MKEPEVRLPEVPIPDKFSPGVKFFADGGDPVVFIPRRGLNCVSGDGLLRWIPASEFARSAPPSDTDEAEWRERVARLLGRMEKERERPSGTIKSADEMEHRP